MPRSVREQLGVDLPAEQEVVDQPEIAAVEEAAAIERPEWLPENFERPEDLATSYREAQNRIREQGEAQGRLEAQLATLTNLVEGMNHAPAEQAPQMNEQLMTAYENDPIGTMVYLARQAAAAEVQTFQQTQQPVQQTQERVYGEMVSNTAQSALAGRYDDWAKYAPKVGEAIAEDPTLVTMDTLKSLDTTVKALDRIYKQVKYDDMVTQLGQATQQSQDTTQMKQQAQTVSGQGTRPGELSENDAKIERLIAAAKANSYSSWRG